MKPVVIGSILALSAAYFADYVVARSRPLGSVQVQPYYAIHEKNGKTEYEYNVPPESESCVASALPHQGDSPCWYLSRHKTRKIDI